LRRRHQRRVQLVLAGSGLLYRMDLGPQVIGPQVIVRDAQPASRVAF
jgi:hypothetical protein